MVLIRSGGQNGPLINSFINANEMHVSVPAYGGNAATRILKWQISGAGQVAQCLRSHTEHVENPSSVPGTLCGWLRTIYSSSSPVSNI